MVLCLGFGAYVWNLFCVPSSLCQHIPRPLCPLIQLFWIFLALCFLPRPPKEISTLLKSLYFKSDNFKQVLHILKMAISMWYNNQQTSGWNINLTDVGYYTCFMNFQFSTKPDATFPSPLASGCVLFSVHTICFNGFRALCVQDAETERRRWLPCSRSPHTGGEDRHDDDVTEQVSLMITVMLLFSCSSCYFPPPLPPQSYPHFHVLLAHSS